MNDRPAVERQVVGALKSTIDAHGPITRANVSSAAKRIVSALKAKERSDAVPEHLIGIGGADPENPGQLVDCSKTVDAIMEELGLDPTNEADYMKTMNLLMAILKAEEFVAA